MHGYARRVTALLHANMPVSFSVALSTILCFFTEGIGEHWASFDDDDI